MGYYSMNHISFVSRALVDYEFSMYNIKRQRIRIDKQLKSVVSPKTILVLLRVDYNCYNYTINMITRRIRELFGIWDHQQCANILPNSVCNVN